MERTIYLYGVEKDIDNTSASGFCQKLETYLRLRKLKYEHVATYPPLAPKGKLPYVKYEEDVVPDSGFVIKYIEQKIGPLDTSETLQEKAHIRAWQSYIEDTLYPCVVYDRWYPDEHYFITAQETFGKISWPLRDMLSVYFRSLIQKSMYTVGVGRHTREEVEIIAKECFTNISVLLGDEQYFSKKTAPNLLDVIMYSFLVNILGLEGNVFTKKMVLQSKNLLVYVQHMTQAIYPEYTKILTEISSVLTTLPADVAAQE